MTAAGVLSSYFGDALLDEEPLVGSSLLGPDAWTPSPDTMLADAAVPAPQLPGVPPARQTTRNEPGTIAAPPGAAAGDGDAAQAIDAAMGYLGTMYQWGGTGANGRVDCSGLLFAAFNAAGVKMPRYRAVDYGHMGAPVSVEQARPGDIVYYDNPNSDTDHVGLYLGNGRFIEAPTPGERVQISPLRGGAQIRRILPDSAFSALPADPGGRLTFHAENNVYTGGRAPATHPGAQRDPVEQLKALDAAQSLEAIEAPPDVSSILDSFGSATPDSIFGQATAAHYRTTSDRAAPTTGRGLTVGQATGLSPAEAWIIQRESGGDPEADNPTSTAYGIWQGLAATRKAYAGRFGYSPDTRNVGEQLVMFRAYIDDRYGSAENAKRFWERNHWYAVGPLIFLYARVRGWV